MFVLRRQVKIRTRTEKNTNRGFVHTGALFSQNRNKIFTIKKYWLGFSFASTSKCKLCFKEKSGCFKLKMPFQPLQKYSQVTNTSLSWPLPWKSSWLGFSEHTEEFDKEPAPLAKCLWQHLRCPFTLQQRGWSLTEPIQSGAGVLSPLSDLASQILAWPEPGFQNVQSPWCLSTPSLHL